MENMINEMAKRSLVNPIIPVAPVIPMNPVNPMNNINSNDKTNKPGDDYDYDYDNYRYDGCGVIGICYVPMQKWEQIYDEDTAFSVGTIFPSLNLPFLGGGK